MSHELPIRDLLTVRVYRPEACLAFVEAHGIAPTGAQRGALGFHDRPYQRGVFEAVDDPEVEEIVCLWCSQSGKSTVLLNVLQWHACTRPTNAMVGLPNDRSRNDFVDDRLRTAIFGSPKWKEQLAPVADPIIQSKIRYAGKALYLALMGSESDLAQRDCELVALDEADKQREKTGKEGSAEKQIEARTRTFRRAKRFLIGTPTLKGSPLDRGWKRSSQQVWTVPCPECGKEFAWSLADLRWGERPEVEGRKRGLAAHAAAIEAGEVPVWYQPPCGCRLEGQQAKDRANRRGRLVALRPEVRRTVGIRISAFDIPDESFESIACEYLRAKHDEDAGDERNQQHFFNHWLAQSFSPKRVALGEDAVASRVTASPAGEVPSGFNLVTVGADVQDNRIYWVAAAWKVEPLACHVVDFGCLRFGQRADAPAGEEGASADLTTMLTSNLSRLEELAVNRVWRGPGFEGRARAVGIDSGDGEHRDLVYRFAARTGRHVRPVKGERQPFRGGQLVRLNTDEREDHRGRLVLVCPVAVSDQIAAWYKSISPDVPGSREGLTFCDRAGEDKEFQRQLVSMERAAKGWVLRDGHASDHYWDALRYAVAMAAVCGVFRPQERRQPRKPVIRRPPEDPFGRRL